MEKPAVVAMASSAGLKKPKDCICQIDHTPFLLIKTQGLLHLHPNLITLQIIEMFLLVYILLEIEGKGAP